MSAARRSSRAAGGAGRLALHRRPPRRPAGRLRDARRDAGIALDARLLVAVGRHPGVRPAPNGHGDEVGLGLWRGGGAEWTG